MWWFNPAAVHIVQYIGHPIQSGLADLCSQVSAAGLNRQPTRSNLNDTEEIIETPLN